MKKITKKIIIYFCFLFIIAIFSGIYALLIYFGKANSKIGAFNIVTFIFGIIAFFILGFLAGNTAQKNGLLEGLVAALFIIFISLIINFFIEVPFASRSFAKIASFSTASALGGILGVNFRSFLGAKSE